MQMNEAMNVISDAKARIYHQVSIGNPQPKVQIGGSEFTENEWKKLMKWAKDQSTAKEEESENGSSAEDRKDETDIFSEYKRLQFTP